MKKTRTALILMLAGTVSFSVGLWLYAQQEPLTLTEYSIAALVLLVVIFGFVIGMRRIRDVKRGLPAEDELSHQIKQKAAASAFTGSFYLWMLIAMFVVDSGLRPELPVGVGLLGMGVLFVAFWIYYSKAGVQDANAD